MVAWAPTPVIGATVAGSQSLPSRLDQATASVPWSLCPIGPASLPVLGSVVVVVEVPARPPLPLMVLDELVDEPVDADPAGTAVGGRESRVACPTATARVPSAQAPTARLAPAAGPPRGRASLQPVAAGPPAAPVTPPDPAPPRADESEPQDPDPALPNTPDPDPDPKDAEPTATARPSTAATAAASSPAPVPEPNCDHLDPLADVHIPTPSEAPDGESWSPTATRCPLTEVRPCSRTSAQPGPSDSRLQVRPPSVEPSATAPKWEAPPMAAAGRSTSASSTRRCPAWARPTGVTIVRGLPKGPGCLVTSVQWPPAPTRTWGWPGWLSMMMVLGPLVATRSALQLPAVPMGAGSATSRQRRAPMPAIHSSWVVALPPTATMCPPPRAAALMTSPPGAAVAGRASLGSPHISPLGDSHVAGCQSGPSRTAPTTSTEPSR